MKVHSALAVVNHIQIGTDTLTIAFCMRLLPLVNWLPLSLTFLISFILAQCVAAAFRRDIMTYIMNVRRLAYYPNPPLPFSIQLRAFVRWFELANRAYKIETIGIASASLKAAEMTVDIYNSVKRNALGIKRVMEVKIGEAASSLGRVLGLRGGGFSTFDLKSPL